MNKNAALLVTLCGAAVAIGAWNPFFGEPNLHPSPWVVCPGATVAAIGGYLLGFRAVPRQPGMRAAGVAVACVGLGLASLLL